MAQKWKERKEEKISAGGPSFTISGTVVGSVGVNEGTFNSEIDNFFQGPFEKNETRDPNQNPYDQHFTWNSNGSLSKLPEISNQLLDLLRYGIHKITSEDSFKMNMVVYLYRMKWKKICNIWDLI
ncbi:unnamed protein product [Rhizophagus irregularis]|nr:unnamed protein product [Rhizophagus irregularis]